MNLTSYSACQGPQGWRFIDSNVYISFCHDAKATRQDLVKKLVLQGVLWAAGGKD